MSDVTERDTVPGSAVPVAVDRANGAGRFDSSDQSRSVTSQQVVVCDGSRYCTAETHIHGCFADEGNCDEPAEHYDVEGVTT